MTRALSKLKLRYQTSQGKEKLIRAAVELFHKSRNEAILNNQKVPSYTEIARICNVLRETLRRRIAQLPSRLEAAAMCGWLNHVETQQLIDHILRCADLGFPHGRKEIERHALELARVRHPDLAVLGSGWVDRFVARNHDQLRVHWTSNLDHSRAAGVNPTAVAHWFHLVGSAFQEYEFAHENIYGFDESGFPFGGDGSKQRVIGRTDASIQHVQHGGNRENVTVMVTICADGTTTRPTVIFKGKKMFSDWTRSNVANMRRVNVTVTENGWTDASMAVWWLRNFDEQTREKAAGRPRLLLVDGHSSHYTVEFIKYAREANIIVLCYPSHTTHVLQGLDVVAFAILKRRWHAARDCWESEHWPQKLSKPTFIQLFGTIFLETMSEELVKECFEKTGIVPFNDEIVTSRQMAPSKEHSTKIDIDGLPSPVKRIVSFQSQLIALKRPSSREDIDIEITDLHPSQDPHAFSTPAVLINNDGEDDIMLPLTPTDSTLGVHTSREMCVDDELSSDVFMDSIDPALRPSSPIHDDGLEEMEVDPVTENLDSYGSDNSENVEPQALALPMQQDALSSPSALRTPPHLLWQMFNGSSANFLVGNAPIKSSFEVPNPVYGAAPTIPTLTATETTPGGSKACTKAELLAKNAFQLRELKACREALHNSSNTIDVLNAQLALSKMAYAKARQQLVSQEERHAAPKRKEISTVLGHVLTHESFLNAQMELDRRQEDAEEAKAKEVLERDWKKYEEEYEEGVKLWKAEVERRKAAKEKGHVLKPKKMAKRVWLAARATITSDDIDTSAVDDAGDDMEAE